MPSQPAVPSPRVGRAALLALLRGRNLLEPLAALHAELGDVFQIPLPGFNPIVLAGPEAARFVLVEARGDLRWRIETDPLARLLRHGLLVEDDDAHDALRSLMKPAFHRALAERLAGVFWQCTDEAACGWPEGQAIDVTAEIRRLALGCLGRSLFDVDMTPDIQAIWQPLLRTLAYIGPGAWLLWPAIPRPGYRRALRQMDDYLFRLIALRRARPEVGEDLLSLLVNSGLSDDVIRDQLLTMLIAGHDTTTAALAWALHTLSQHPHVMARARDEVDCVLKGEPPTAARLGRLTYLEQIIKEVLRLSPPIHVSNRLAARDLVFDGHAIPAGTRVLFSIYLTHRHAGYWPQPERFDPDRFDAARRPAPFTYLPFGGGPRFCIGAALAQVELRVVLARLLQRFHFMPVAGRVRLRMGATLEPAGLQLRLRRRKAACGNSRNGHRNDCRTMRR